MLGNTTTHWSLCGCIASRCLRLSIRHFPNEAVAILDFKILNWFLHCHLGIQNSYLIFVLPSRTHTLHQVSSRLDNWKCVKIWLQHLKWTETPNKHTKLHKKYNNTEFEFYYMSAPLSYLTGIRIGVWELGCPGPTFKILSRH